MESADTGTIEFPSPNEGAARDRGMTELGTQKSEARR
jgi:hypothetical protein